jgi:hypothetical protein
MLELHTLLSAAKSAGGNGNGNDNNNNNGSDDNLTPDQKRNMSIVIAIIVVVELILLVWAILRAIKCSQASPDSRAIHLLFAIVSPFLYLVFSYAVDGFCPSN